MMDNFKEDIVSPRSNALGNVLYALCWGVHRALRRICADDASGGDGAVQRVDARYGGDGGRLRRAAVLHQGSAQGGI